MKQKMWPRRFCEELCAKTPSANRMFTAPHTARNYTHTLRLTPKCPKQTLIKLHHYHKGSSGACHINQASGMPNSRCTSLSLYAVVLRAAATLLLRYLLLSALCVACGGIFSSILCANPVPIRSAVLVFSLMAGFSVYMVFSVCVCFGHVMCSCYYC